MKKYSIVTWNVNGIRAVSQKGFMEWLKKRKHDVVCLQEIKADLEKIPQEIIQHKDYQCEAFPAERKGYSGVLTLSKEKTSLTEKGLANKVFSSEGRTLISHFKDFILLNCYFPNGGRDHSRVPYKMKYCDSILRKCQKLEKDFKKPVIICGDYNTAHHPIDLSNPKSNKNTTGFLEIERAWLDKFEKKGFVDCFRKLNPEKKDIYSWWTYRNNCRERNIGWRIDYFFINEKYLNKVKGCNYHHKVLGSDHCPVELILEI